MAAITGAVLTFTAGVYHNRGRRQTAMGRKEYREADLSPDQFFFQTTGHETPSLIG